MDESDLKFILRKIDNNRNKINTIQICTTESNSKFDSDVDFHTAHNSLLIVKYHYYSEFIEIKDIIKISVEW